MPKISKDAGPSYFPEGAIIRDTDDPALVALARDKGATVIDPGNREPHEVLAHGERLAARHRAEDEQQTEQDDRTDTDSGTRTGVESGEVNWTAARTRDEQQ